MRQKGFIPVIFVFIVAVAAVIVVFAFTRPQLWNAPNSASFTPPVVTSTPVSGRNVYQNDTWKFQIELPDSWTGFKVTEHDWRSQAQSDYSADLCFYFERDSAIPACILQISIYSQEEWNNPGYNTLGEQNGYIFVANEFDSRCVQLDEFQCDRFREIDAIVDTFRFTE